MQTCALGSVGGKLDLAQVERALSARFAHTSLVSMENTHNFLGGVVLPLDYMKALCDLAHSRGAQVYLDGARILNASVRTGIPVVDYASCCDALMFCLSKGLCAPAGSMLCGSADFIRRADSFRKTFGGMLKQPGPLAECGIVALTAMVKRLSRDHANAARLADALRRIPEAARHMEIDEPQTNILFVTLKSMDADLFIGECSDRGVLALHIGAGRVRWVTHNDVEAEDVDRSAAVVADILAGHVSRSSGKRR